MENNALQVDYSNWEKGKQYPEWMDEISLATISKGYLLPNNVEWLVRFSITCFIKYGN